MITELFSSPTPTYKPAPLWVWNDLMDKQQIYNQLQELKQQGFGGVFIHPRPGLITEYLSDEWFEHWSYALEIAKEMNLKIYIYDENSYPSGFAGGHVPSELPDCLANCVVMEDYTNDDLSTLVANASPMLNKPGHPIRAYSYKKLEESNSIEIIKDMTEIPFSEWEHYGNNFLYFKLGVPETNAWLGGFAYVDLLRPEVTELFLKTTYERYQKRYGKEFGRNIPAIFTDEPEISPGNLFEDQSNVLPFTYWFASQFEDINGYDLKDVLPYLFFEVKSTNQPTLSSEKVRYDYYHTIHKLWVNNSVKPISDWCEEHNIAFTGHYLEHNWPYPWGRTSPSVMSLYEYMHWPAIDMLTTGLLKRDGTDPLGMLTIREAQSVANQFNKERVLCEAYGAGGYDSTFEDYKRIGDWLFVHGINFLNQHLTFGTIVGARKRDHPQTFDWRQPWWSEYKELNDYYSRLSYILSEGETINKILVIHPTTTAYLKSPRTADARTRVEDIDYFNFLQNLSDAQIGYDLGDEYIISKYAKVQEKEFVIKNRGYHVIIIPSYMDNMMQSTVEALQNYLGEGGTVLALHKPRYVEGKRNHSLKDLFKHPNWLEYESLKKLLAYFEDHSLVEFKLTTHDEPLPKGIAHLSRVHTDGSKTYFIVNSSPEDINNLTLKLAGKYVEQLDPWDGKIKTVDYEENEGELTLSFSLSSIESKLFRVYEQRPDTAARSTVVHEVKDFPTSRKRLNTPTTITTEKNNVLSLDYLDLNIGRKKYKEINAVHAQRLVFEYHGFEMNPWDNGVQFKRRLLDREEHLKQLKNGGFKATYYFEIKESNYIQDMKVLVERPELYDVLINDHLLTFGASDGGLLDHHIKEASILNAVKEGINKITLIAKTFSILMELEPIYIMGDFRIDQVHDQWCIQSNKPLKIGDWREQGYPFYPYAVQYRKQIHVNDLDKEVFVKLNKWEGTVISVIVNDQMSGIIIKQEERKEITPFLKKGLNNIVIRVSGSMKNLFGPHHNADHPRKIAGPIHWKNAPKFGQPKASKYDFIPSGLLEDFDIEMRK